MPFAGFVGCMGVGNCPGHPPLPPVPYTTVIVSGAANVPVNGSPAAIITCLGVASCGHMTVAITGSGTVLANGLGVHRIGDLGINIGQYVLTTGSANVNVGG